MIRLTPISRDSDSMNIVRLIFFTWALVLAAPAQTPQEDKRLLFDPDDTVIALKVDARGHLYVTGETVYADFLTSRPVQHNAAGAAESYLLKLDADNKQVFFSTFWGGSKRDATTALALGPDESVTPRRRNL